MWVKSLHSDRFHPSSAAGEILVSAAAGNFQVGMIDDSPWLVLQREFPDATFSGDEGWVEVSFS